MNKEKIGLTAQILIIVISLALILLVLTKKILPAFLPFLIAWGVAFAVRSPAKRLSEKTRLKENIARPVLAIFLTLAVFGITALAVWLVGTYLWRALSAVGESGVIYDIILKLTDPSLPIFGSGLPEEIASSIGDAFNSALSEMLAALGSFLTGLAAGIPEVLLFLLITVISVLYFAVDLERINLSVKKILPEKLFACLSRFRERLFATLKAYGRSYLLLMLFTYIIVLVGFLILRIKDAPLLALIVALLDLLPVIGVGTVIIPFGIYELLAGRVARGIGLFVLFVVNLVLRQLAEPRIVGKSLDMHPVLTLVFLYVGYSFFGIGGILLIPVFSIILESLIKKDSSAEVSKRTAAEKDGA